MTKLCRFEITPGDPRIGLVLNDNEVLDLTGAGFTRLQPILEAPDSIARLSELPHSAHPKHPLQTLRLLPPLEHQEVWAAGVTYVRSKKARMDESEFSASAYDKVYDAPRPELFFKAVPEKVVPTHAQVGIRRDGKWNVPEPELAFVINSRGIIAGFTIGNDMSSRDIEGENLLYLPQAKVYDKSCALGPWILLGSNEAAARNWNILLEIERAGKTTFSGSTSPKHLKRPFTELVEYLFRSQSFPHGAILLTGTGIVPPDDFTLHQGDVVRITIDGIGTLTNEVTVV